MGLTGALSNTEVTTLLQCLTGRDWHKAKRPCKPAAGWLDGRRQFGTVRDAIVEVLSRADSELRVKDIQAGVEALLNNPVSRSSVKSYLHKGCRRRIPLFENLGWGRYRLLG